MPSNAFAVESIEIEHGFAGGCEESAPFLRIPIESNDCLGEAAERRGAAQKIRDSSLVFRRVEFTVLFRLAHRQSLQEERSDSRIEQIERRLGALSRCDDSSLAGRFNARIEGRYQGVAMRRFKPKSASATMIRHYVTRRR
jgi:hypothetical protein